MAFAHYEAHTPAEATARPETRDRNLTLALLMLLAAALFAWYRYGEITARFAESSGTSIVVTPPPAATDTPYADRDTAVTARRERREAAARATARSSSPRPVAGNPLPEYPITALRRGEGGTVLLQVQIDKTGQPIDVDVARRSGSRDLDRAAVQTVRDWRFEPATRNGKPVSSVVELPIAFQPQG